MKRIGVIIVVLILSMGAKAQLRWAFELQGAGVFNLPLPLKISQQGYPDIHLTARYSTEPFTFPLYYDGRISRWDKDKSWEMEFVHHKLYLNNTTPEIQKFNISHGFNFLFVNRGFDHQSFCYRAGAGVVIAHPESQIRGKTFGNSTKDNDMGYFLAGPALQLSINRPFYMGDRFFINTEAKTTFGYSSVKVAQGKAEVFNIAFHLVLGLGMDFKRNENIH